MEAKLAESGMHIREKRAAVIDVIEQREGLYSKGREADYL
jgi:hypothetical protein